MLTATTGVVLALALALAGCGGGDKKSDSTAQNAADATTPAATSTTGTSTGSKTGKTGSKKTPTATTDALPAPAKRKTTTTSKKSSSTKKAASKPATKKTSKAKTTKTPAATPSSSGSDLTSGTGSGPIADREDVVTVLRRYYKAFIDKDAGAVCGLLTSAGQKIMIEDGNAKTCEASAKKIIDAASGDNVTLLQRTRDGLHPDDITVRGNDATAQIGKKSSLKLVQQDGRWLLASPNVVNT